MVCCTKEDQRQSSFSLSEVDDGSRHRHVGLVAEKKSRLNGTRRTSYGRP